MKRVVIESPYAGRSKAPWPFSIFFKWLDRRRNVAYLRECLRDSFLRGEAPFASHGLYPGALDDDVPAERTLGINAGFVWGDVAALRVFYIDRGWSKGMHYGSDRANMIGQKREERSIRWNKKPEMPRLEGDFTPPRKGDEP